MAVTYTTQIPQISDSYAAFFPVKPSDFGVLAPGAGGDGGWSNSNLAYNAGAGSLAMGTANVKITYVTALGETLPSSNATVSVAAGSGAVTVTLPTSIQSGSQALAQAVTGWNVYSAGTTSVLLTNNSPIAIATTTFQITSYGAGAAPPTQNTSGLQQALPQIGANTSVDYFALVNRQFRPNRIVEWIRPNSSADPSALLVSAMDCIGPTWPASTAVTAYKGSSVANSSFLYLNGILYGCTTAGTTGSTVPQFNQAFGATTTDNTAVWTSLGPRGLIRIRFSNTSGTAGIPVAQEYDLFQL